MGALVVVFFIYGPKKVKEFAKAAREAKDAFNATPEEKKDETTSSA